MKSGFFVFDRATKRFSSIRSILINDHSLQLRLPITLINWFWHVPSNLSAYLAETRYSLTWLSSHFRAKIKIDLRSFEIQSLESSTSTQQTPLLLQLLIQELDRSSKLPSWFWKIFITTMCLSLDRMDWMVEWLIVIAVSLVFIVGVLSKRL